MKTRESFRMAVKRINRLTPEAVELDAAFGGRETRVDHFHDHLSLSIAIAHFIARHFRQRDSVLS